jgi:O-6-methylguanine DNA methyltransferase
VRGGEYVAALREAAIAACDHPAEMPDLPLDVDGTAFQQAVWRELRRIPPGETRSYRSRRGRRQASAVRAAGSANGANNVAVLIPCHRVIRSDGTLGAMPMASTSSARCSNAKALDSGREAAVRPGKEADDSRSFNALR